MALAALPAGEPNLDPIPTGAAPYQRTEKPEQSQSQKSLPGEPDRHRLLPWVTSSPPLDITRNPIINK